MDDDPRTPPPDLDDPLAAPDDTPAAAIDAFISRWQHATGTERANYQLFLTELCTLLDLPRPEPAREDHQDNAYCFKRRVIFEHGDGSQSQGFIDLYRRTCYVLECKQTGLGLDTTGWDKAMLRAHGQAVQYARGLPAAEGRPPFVVVVDVGRSIELYSEFSRSGGAYIPYPDPRSHRIRLEDLRRPAIRARLRAVWLDPLSLDPSRRAARVTRDIATRLARLACSLEAAGHPPQLAAAFLIRCLFTLFAEDIGLLPKAAFTDLLRSVRDTPAQFVPLTRTPQALGGRGARHPGVARSAATADGDGRGRRRPAPVARSGAQPARRRDCRDGPVDRLLAMAFSHPRRGQPAGAGDPRLSQHPVPRRRARRRPCGVRHRRRRPNYHPLGRTHHQAPPGDRRTGPG